MPQLLEAPLIGLLDAPLPRLDLLEFLFHLLGVSERFRLRLRRAETDRLIDYSLTRFRLDGIRVRSSHGHKDFTNRASG